MAKINWDKPDPSAPTRPFNSAVTEPREQPAPAPKLPTPEHVPAPRPRGPMGDIATEASREAQAIPRDQERAQRNAHRNQMALIIRTKLEAAPQSLNGTFRAQARGRD